MTPIIFPDQFTLCDGREIFVQKSATYCPLRWPGERNLLPSMTIPDQSMSLQEMIDRFVHGIPVNAAKVPFYAPDDFDDDDLEPLPDPLKMDPVDRQEMAEEAQAYLLATSKALENEKKRFEKGKADKKDPLGAEASGDATD